MNLKKGWGYTLILIVFTSCAGDNGNSISDHFYTSKIDTITTIDSIYLMNYKLLDSLKSHSFINEIVKKHTEPSTIHFNFFNIFICFFIFGILLLGCCLFYFRHASRKFEKYYGIGKEFDWEKGSPLQCVIYDLSISITKYNLIGLVGTLLLVGLIAILGVFVFDLFRNTLNEIKKFHSSNTFLVSLLIFLRTSLLGTFIISLMLYVSKFTNASFDQAARFNKRKHAAIFLLDLFKKFTPDPTTKSSSIAELDSIMNAFREWNFTVQSAFTSSKGKTENDEGNSKFEDLIYNVVKENLKPDSRPKNQNGNIK